MRDRNWSELEAVLGGQRLQRRDRLLAVGTVVEDERDLLALEVGGAAKLLGHVLDGDVGGRPVGAEQREVVGESRAVLRIGAAVSHGDDRDLVGLRLLRQREGDAGRQRVEERRAGLALALQALVALHALVGRVGGLALLDEQLHAVDAAVALIHQAVVVGNAVGVGHAVHGVGAGAVGQDGVKLLVLRRSRRGKRRARKDGSRQDQCVANHFLLLLIGSGLAAQSL